MKQNMMMLLLLLGVLLLCSSCISTATAQLIPVKECPLVAACCEEVRNESKKCVIVLPIPLIHFNRTYSKRIAVALEQHGILPGV